MLEPYRVLDLSDERGLFCARILSELGADVIHVEPPGGSPARVGPWAGGEPDPERSLTWWAMARGDRSVVLDLDDPADRERFLALVRTADILVESADPGHWEARGLGYATLSEVNPALVWVSMTPFGPDGPKAGYAATDLVVQAASGAMAITGEAGRAPLRAAAVPAWTHAAAEAAGGSLIALWEALRSGRGQKVEVSAQRATNLTAQFMQFADSVGHKPISRSGGFSLQGIDFPFVWPVADGFVSFTLALDPMNQAFLKNLFGYMEAEGYGAPGITDIDWVVHFRAIRSGDKPREDLITLRDAVGAFFATRTKAELFSAALDRKLLLVPVATFEDLYESPQLAHREYWTTEELPDGSSALLADHLVRSTRPRSRPRSPAPRIGQHTAEVLAELASGEARQPAAAATPQATEAAEAERSRAVVRGVYDPDQPLAGVKVLDMMWVMAGPYSTGILAQYGATVVRVENEARMDTARLLAPWYDGKASKEGSLGFGSINVNKLSVTVDPNSPEGRAVILDLVQWADVVTESFSPRAMTKWALDYESLRKVKPDLIMISSCLMGQEGPHAYVAGYGTMGAAAAGLVQPTGWPDAKPSGPYGAYTDYCAPRISVAAIMAALDHKRRTGEGQYLDQSQIEATLNYAMPAVLDHQLNRNPWDRVGNADPDMVPHGVYPSAGDDLWVAVACRDDADWAQLCAVLERPEWAGLDLAGRREREAEIDEAVSTWTGARSNTAAEQELQALGVPAHAVLDGRMPADPQLVHQNHLVNVAHVDRGEVQIERTRIELTRTPPRPERFPKLGQFTEQVLTDILGYDEERIAALRRAGALGSARIK